ncbi:MAG: hypothetical protein ABJA57_04190 [Ginsengibacter sp.]
MESSSLKKAAILTLLLVVICVGSWELYLRNKGFPIDYNDDASLWSTQRRMIYKPIDQETIFIGASRIKFDLDIPTWERVTGEKAIQLSFVGTSPRPLLQDLANDNNFKGKVIVDVTEPIFFNRNTKRTEKSARDGLEFYKKWTPAQKVSASINNILESGFVFLDKTKLSLNAILDHLPVPKRKEVFIFPYFPAGFENCLSNRQNFMTQSFLQNPAKLKKQTDNWTILGALDKTPGITGDSLISVFQELKTSIDKIKARGGKVLFVRTPSSGGYWETEHIVYPKEKYWDPMLAYTNTPGIHFKDYPEIASLSCPEWSHLAPKDVLTFTESFIKILEQKGWSFPHKQNIALNQKLNSKTCNHGL